MTCRPRATRSKRWWAIDTPIRTSTTCANACTRLGSGTVANCSAPCYSAFVTKTIAQRALRNDNAKVIEAVAAGQTFVVTRNGVPVAELRPIAPPRRRFVAKADLVALRTGGAHVDLGAFRADLDRIVDQSL